MLLRSRIVQMDDNSNSGESGALVELVTCNSLDITQLWLVVPTPPDGTFTTSFLQSYGCQIQ